MIQIPDPFPRLTCVEREMSALGCFMVHGAKAIQCAPDLMPEHFAEPVLADMFAEVRRRIMKNEPHDGVAIQRHFSGDVRFEPFGGAAMFVAKLVSMSAPLVDMEYIGRELIDMANRRAIASAMLQAFQEIPHRPVNEIMSEVQNAFRGAHSGVGRYQVSRAVEEALSASEAARSGRASDFITTGFEKIDEVVGGYPVGEVTVLAGRPGMGKTAFAVSTALNIARAGYKVLFISLEMPAARLAHRMISSLIHEENINHSMLWLPYLRLINGRYSDEDRSRIEHAVSRLSSLPIEIIDTPRMTASDIEAEIIRWNAGNKGHGIVIVDYLGIVKPSRRYYGDIVSETTEKIGDLKAAAKRNNVAMLVLSQLNREVEKRNDKRPQLSDLRDSGAIEQDAHTVMMVYREEYYLQKEIDEGGEKAMESQSRLNSVKGKLEVLCLKNRNGPTARFEMNAHMETNYIS